MAVAKADEHKVLLCLFEALNVYPSDYIFPGLHSLSLAQSGVIEDSAPSGLVVAEG